MWSKVRRSAAMAAMGWMLSANVAGATGVDVACVSVAPAVSVAFVSPAVVSLVVSPSVVVSEAAVFPASVALAEEEATVVVRQSIRSRAPVVLRSRTRVALAPTAVLRVRTFVSRGVSRLSVLGERVCH